MGPCQCSELEEIRKNQLKAGRNKAEGTYKSLKGSGQSAKGDTTEESPGSQGKSFKNERVVICVKSCCGSGKMRTEREFTNGFSNMVVTGDLDKKVLVER